MSPFRWDYIVLASFGRCPFFAGTVSYRVVVNIPEYLYQDIPTVLVQTSQPMALHHGWLWHAVAYRCAVKDVVTSLQQHTVGVFFVIIAVLTSLHQTAWSEKIHRCVALSVLSLLFGAQDPSDHHRHEHLTRCVLR